MKGIITVCTLFAENATCAKTQETESIAQREFDDPVAPISLLMFMPSPGALADDTIFQHFHAPFF